MHIIQLQELEPNGFVAICCYSDVLMHVDQYVPEEDTEVHVATLDLTIICVAQIGSAVHMTGLRDPQEQDAAALINRAATLNNYDSILQVNGRDIVNISDLPFCDVVEYHQKCAQQLHACIHVLPLVDYYCNRTL